MAQNAEKALSDVSPLMAMVNGKVSNAAMGNKPTMRCNICKATQASFKDIKKIKKLPVDQQALNFGISPQHCKIQAMEAPAKLGLSTWLTNQPSSRRSEYPLSFTNKWSRKLMMLSKPFVNCKI